MREIVLDAERLQNKADVCSYMNELFSFDEPVSNLDALADDLSEVSEETKFVLTRNNVHRICENAYAYKVLILIGKVCDQNPYLTVTFQK